MKHFAPFLNVGDTKNWGINLGQIWENIYFWRGASAASARVRINSFSRPVPFSQSWSTGLHQISGGHEPSPVLPEFILEFRCSLLLRN